MKNKKVYEKKNLCSVILISLVLSSMLDLEKSAKNIGVANNMMYKIIKLIFKYLLRIIESDRRPNVIPSPAGLHSVSKIVFVK